MGAANTAHPLSRCADALTWCRPPRRDRIKDGSTLVAPAGGRRVDLPLAVRENPSNLEERL